MRENFARSLPLVLAHEGGWSDHPDDPGGATMHGITLATYSGWLGRKATKGELRAIPDAVVAAIYRRNYWDAVKGDDLPAGLDYATFDFAVNSGAGRAARQLQEILGVAVDGKIGPKTLAASRSRLVADTIDDLCDDRLAFLERLKTWPTFGTGWSRRVAGVRKEAQHMALMAVIDPPEPNPKPTRPGLLARIFAALFGR